MLHKLARHQALLRQGDKVGATSTFSSLVPRARPAERDENRAGQIYACHLRLHCWEA